MRLMIERITALVIIPLISATIMINLIIWVIGLTELKK